jgi:hypothetical protein
VNPSHNRKGETGNRSPKVIVFDQKQPAYSTSLKLYSFQLPLSYLKSGTLSILLKQISRTSFARNLVGSFRQLLRKNPYASSTYGKELRT